MHLLKADKPKADTIMVASCKDLWINANFILKFAVFICLFILIGFGHSYGYINIVIGYEQSCLTVIVVLLITYWLFELTKITELCLLVAALVKLFVATVFHATRGSTCHNYNPQQELVDTGISDEADVETRISDEAVVETRISYETVVRNTIGRAVGTIVEAATKASVNIQEESAADTVIAAATVRKQGSIVDAALLDRANVGANSDISIRYSEPDGNQYYIRLVINIIAIILIAVDIFLRAKK